MSAASTQGSKLVAAAEAAGVLLDGMAAGAFRLFGTAPLGFAVLLAES